MRSDVLERWLEDVVATPGLTSLHTLEEARRVLLEDALRALPVVEATSGPIVDVGSGGGSPGIPLAAALPDRRVAPRRVAAAEVRLPLALCSRAPERRCRLGAGRGAARRGVRRRARQGAREAAHCVRALRAVGTARWNRGALDGGDRRPRVRGAGRRHARGRARERSRRASGDSQDGADTAGISASPGHGEEAPHRLTLARASASEAADTLALCPPGSTQWRTRRAASARRRPR